LPCKQQLVLWGLSPTSRPTRRLLALLLLLLLLLPLLLLQLRVWVQLCPAHEHRACLVQL
jgi:hypothetical protein